MAPGDCPSLCPSSQAQPLDTTLSAVVSSDTSFRGFVTAREAPILVASDLGSWRGLALVRFEPRASFWIGTASDTILLGSTDSVILEFRLIQRDTAAKDLRLLVYRLPPTSFDTATAFGAAAPLFADARLMDSIPIADSLTSGLVRQKLAPERFDSLDADSGVVALGVAVRAASPTAVTVAAGDLSAEGPSLRFYGRGQPPREATTHTYDLAPAFDTFVTDPEPSGSADAAVVGNIPSARTLLRLEVPETLLDSTAIVRATLVLTQTRPAFGRPREEFELEARAVLRDFGGKSFAESDTSLVARTTVRAGSATPVELELGRILRFWGTPAGDSVPRAILLRVVPEGSVLGEVSLARASAGADAPTLRVTYLLPYRFGVP